MGSGYGRETYDLPNSTMGTAVPTTSDASLLKHHHQQQMPYSSTAAAAPAGTAEGLTQSEYTPDARGQQQQGGIMAAVKRAVGV